MEALARGHYSSVCDFNGAGATSVFFNSYALFTSIVAITVMLYVGMGDDIIGLSPILRLVIEKTAHDMPFEFSEAAFEL